jgi:hypothetical protein
MTAYIVARYARADRIRFRLRGSILGTSNSTATSSGNAATSMNSPTPLLA